ncbi:RIP metalloprotease RseP [Enterococcus timonensis]|uniref:RIP metalloprotease RseP n=1 Tax=Enterococcus timonensis TaxID=1852364 RepID=UPI0008D9DB0F|nr:RIP metalloprotease RseP [Enterococcus timonensis]
MNIASTIVTFIFVFGVLVIFHEFGHFYFAKKSGILVREFSVGMGPKIFSRQKNGTTYTIRWLPLGGYVRMAGWGEDENTLPAGSNVGLVLKDEKVQRINLSDKIQLTDALPLEVTNADLEKDLKISGFVYGQGEQVFTYPVAHDATIIEQDGTEIRIAPIDVQMQSAKVWQRILVNFAGPLNNFILSLVLFIALVFIQGGVQVTNTNLVGEIQANSAAEVAGLKENDAITAIDGTKITDWQDLTAIVSQSPDTPLQLTVQRNGQTQEVTLIPEPVEQDGVVVGKMGVAAPLKTDLTSKLSGGFHLFIDNSLAIFKVLGSLLTDFSLDKLGGPVMMFQYSSQAAQSGFTTILALMAILSVNLGIMNLLPIPALDGGKIVLNVIEGIRGKPLSPEKEGIVTLIGFVFMFGLMILVTFNDISRYFMK